MRPVGYRRTLTDINEKLNQILNDPGSMQQIMELAASLGGSPEQLPVMPDTIRNVLQQANRTDPRQEALIRALLPYLRPGRQERLERAMQIARLSHLAEFALQTASIAQEQEANHV